MPFKAYEALGLGTPFMLAAATYGLFYWLDRNASAQATRAISGWFKGQGYAKIDIAPTIISLFDKIYKPPLLSLGGFRRSVSVSLITWIGYVIASYLMRHNRVTFDNINLYVSDWITAIILLALFFITIDYVSLFIVRRCLSLGTNHLVFPLIWGFVAGSCVIVLCFAVTMIFMTILVVIYHGYYSRLFESIPLMLTLMLHQILNNPRIYLNTLVPALLIHLWLLLFAAGALGIRLFYPIFRVIVWAQWFLKQGDRHPMRAIGMVAAALMFTVGAIWKTVAAI